MEPLAGNTVFISEETEAGRLGSLSQIRKLPLLNPCHRPCLSKLFQKSYLHMFLNNFSEENKFMFFRKKF